MKMSTKLFIAAVILFILPSPLTTLLSFICVVAGLALLVFQGAMEITNKDETHQKRKDTTPPWEK